MQMLKRLWRYVIFLRLWPSSHYDNLQGDSQDVPKSQTPLPTTKRVHDHSSSPSLGASTSAKHSRKGRRHARGADSMLEVVSAIWDMSKTFTTSGLPTPEQRQQVIQLLKDDGDFSDNEQVHVIGLFADNMAIADTFIHIRKKNVCTTFIRSKIGDRDLWNFFYSLPLSIVLQL